MQLVAHTRTTDRHKTARGIPAQDTLPETRRPTRLPRQSSEAALQVPLQPQRFHARAQYHAAESHGRRPSQAP